MVDWAALGLVFGGCCSNALTLERVTSEYPKSGSLITFSQFVLISLHGLPKFISFTRGPFNIPIPRLRPRRIPLTPYLIQVVLFYSVSLLNNIAFGYNIPMPVHIIFRSGGLVVSMLMGWLLSGKSYTISQVLSVLIVTVGVILTTLSSHRRQEMANASSLDPPRSRYITGIGILTLALGFSGFLGVVQDKTFTSYARDVPTQTKPKRARSSATTKTGALPNVWEESMFYLHFLALPMFVFVRHDLKVQAKAFLSSQARTITFYTPLAGAQFTLPAVLPALLANTLTYFVCVAGVNRLTTRVPALTVTLVLVVRKAVSLVLSVLPFEGSDVAWGMLWSGAFLVFAGTVGYTVSERARKKGKKE